MNSLNLEQRNNRLLYRELFFKANEGFKEQLSILKRTNFCKNDKMCCKIRYSGLSPLEIRNLKADNDKAAVNYAELFVPWGYNKDFDWEKADCDVKFNNDCAKSAFPDYVNLVLSKLPGPLYFYYCKNLDKNGICVKEGEKTALCSFPNAVATILPQECGFREWQRLSLIKIKNEISRDILLKLQEIELRRQTFSCKKTGTCCKLSSSEYSYETLLEKAKNGDKFATQFTSVFVPYENREKAKEIFPEYVDFVLSQLDEDENIYFYHCNYLTEDNLCSRYNERPDICKDFPNNPLSILPHNCGFKEWKEEVSVAAMLLHALAEITQFNMERIESALN